MEKVKDLELGRISPCKLGISWYRKDDGLGVSNGEFGEVGRLFGERGFKVRLGGNPPFGGKIRSLIGVGFLRR